MESKGETAAKFATVGFFTTLWSVLARFYFNPVSRKGSFCSRKKIAKISYIGVTVCLSLGVWELQCVGVAISGSCNM